MGLFNFKKKKRGECINQIKNIELREKLGDYAFSLLVPGKDYQEFENPILTFAYLYTFKNSNDIEALFKIINEGKSFYFAAQKKTVIRLKIDENLFNQLSEHDSNNQND